MKIPKLSKSEIDAGLIQAKKSPRRRHVKILHKPGDELNRMFNFLMGDTYMQPHHHPGKEKIEYIRIVDGKIAVIYFDDRGNITKTTVLEDGGEKEIYVPAFTWHTYVALSEHAITYETMRGVYDPKTWKEFSDRWAPSENTPESIAYLKVLKEKVLNTE